MAWITSYFINPEQYIHKIYRMTGLPCHKSSSATITTRTTIRNWVIIVVTIAISVTVGTDAFPLQRSKVRIRPITTKELSFLPQSSSLLVFENDTFQLSGVSNSFRYPTSVHASRNSQKVSQFNPLPKDEDETSCRRRKNNKTQEWKEQWKWLSSTEAAARFGVASALFASILMAPITFDSMDNPNHDERNHISNDISNAKLASSKKLSTKLSQLSHPSTINAWAVSSSKPSFPMNENQQFVSDIWWAVTAQYYDPTYNGMMEDGWRQMKLQAMEQVADTGPDPEDEIIITQAINTMLSKLGDPYTRYLPREKYELLTSYAKGESSSSNGSGGIGVQLLMDPRSSLSNDKNLVMVMNVSDNGPAAKMGMKQGDVILEIDGETMEGATPEFIAAKCRGEVGDTVNIFVQRRSNVDSDVNVQTKKLLSIQRENIKINPVRTSTFISSTSKNGSVDAGTTSDKQIKVGLLTIPAFSQETPKQVIDAIRTVRDQNVQVIAIDLRGNVGGYLPAGIDTSKLFLAGKRPIVAEVNRAGQGTVYYADGIGAETSIPLYILVDSRTASAAEIFSAALQDNKRAILVGSSNTFGKGRIQNVQSVGNGSGVAVTRARYVTPRGNDVHGVGITPNKRTNCSADDSAVICLENII